MELPYAQLRADIKAKKISRINQLIEAAPLADWKEACDFRKGTLERLMENHQHFKIRHVLMFSIAIGVKESTIRRLIMEQGKFNRAAMRAEVQPG